MKLSEKQEKIIKFIRDNKSITKKQAVEMLDDYYFHNAEKYVGEILSNMVKQRYIKRVKNGLFELGSLSNQLPGINDKDQINLF